MVEIENITKKVKKYFIIINKISPSNLLKTGTKTNLPITNKISDLPELK